MNIVTWFKDTTIKSKLYFITAVMLTLIMVELFTLYLMLYILSATRAYVGGEGLWSKAQKNATFYLLEYTNHGRPYDYAKFLEFIKVPLGDRKAREELLKPHPNLEIATQGFLEGGNELEDIPGMISLFTQFQHVYYLKKVISIWGEGDKYITQLLAVGENIHRVIESKQLTPEKRLQFIDQIHVLNTEITVLANNFSYALGNASRWLEGLVLKIVFAIALVVEISGLIFTMFITVSIRKGIDEIMRVSKKVMKLDFSSRAHCYSNDEIGQLAQTFNQMINDLEQSTLAQKKEIADRIRAEEELKTVNQQLLITAREAGKAEVSTSILHNVGNVLNSINVSVNLIREKISRSELKNLKNLANLLNENAHDLPSFLQNDPRGKFLATYLNELSSHWDLEASNINYELSNLAKNIDHINDIINMQQSLGLPRLQDWLAVTVLMDEAINISIDAKKGVIQVIKNYDYSQQIYSDKSKLMQIFINLITNAKDAVLASSETIKKVTVSIYVQENSLYIAVSDNGVGIQKQDLIRIFTFGFTTKKKGHGFGLHMSALFAKELGGELTVTSEGLNKGATFTLRLPLKQK